MKDTIRKFRKVVDILIREKGYTGTRVYEEMKISEPTLTKLMKEDVNEIKVRALVLAAVQDFNKRHIEDLNYAGIFPGENGKEEALVPERKARPAKPAPKQEEAAPLNPTPEPAPIQAIAPAPTEEDPKGLFAKKDFIEMLSKVALELPPNVVINITINEK